MRYGQIRHYDVANGPGIRTSIFVTGCTHRCKGCFNELYMDFNYGNEWTEVQTELILKCLDDETVSGLTVLGGEPMQNTDGLIELISRVREQIERSRQTEQSEQILYPDRTGGGAERIGFSKEKTVWIYSGYTYEEILQDKDRRTLLALCDVLVDGRFVEELKNNRLKFRGSENQRVIDIRESLRCGNVVLMPGYELNPEHSIHKIRFLIQNNQNRILTNRKP